MFRLKHLVSSLVYFGWVISVNSWADKPNILLIVSDDLGYADVGFHGNQEKLTLNLDRLAESGIRFSDGYVSGIVCSPTRAGLMTGRYQQKFGYEFNPDDHCGLGLPLSETTVASRLKAAGYETGLIGKWHLGIKPKEVPLDRGFDEFFGFLRRGNGGAGKYFSPDNLFRDKNPIQEREYITDAFGREAVSFIDRHKRHPWFLYLAFSAVHTPMVATQKRLAKFSKVPDKQRRIYSAMLLAMDEAIGAVTKKLDDENLTKNTMIVFLNDNGGPQAMNASRNDPLRGGKDSVFEGGIRVPFIVSWPGILKPGVFPHPVIQLDFTPTALAAAGILIQPEWQLDGVNLLPFLSGLKSGPPHNELFWRVGQKTAIRAGDYKLLSIDQSIDQSLDPLNKAQSQDLKQIRLYNLAQDIGETTDLSRQMPEKIKELKAKWEVWNSTLIDPLQIHPSSQASSPVKKKTKKGFFERWLNR